MLSYPDRQQFEQIRSRWEAAQLLNDEPATMVGHRDEPITHQPMDIDPISSAAPSRFRRKLSHGLSLIAIPLSQRKVSQGRQQSAGPSLLAGGPGITIDDLDTHESDKLLCPVRETGSASGSTARWTVTPQPSNGASTEKSLDPEATSKPLPRSRTMSYIPRPQRSGSILSLVESDAAIKPCLSAFTPEQEAHATPTSIPTPPATFRRRSSPRQYSHNFTTQQAKHVAAGKAFSVVSAHSPAKVLRSYTTPNLAKEACSPRPTNFMTARRSVTSKSSGTPALQGSVFKENDTPTTQRHSKRLPQIQEQSPRRESMTEPALACNRQSIVSNNAPAHTEKGTPPIARKQLSSQLVPQTPLEAQRAPRGKSTPTKRPRIRMNMNSSVIAEARLMGTVSPPTLPAMEHTLGWPALPRASTEKDLRRRTYTLCSRRTGLGILSRSQVEEGNEVRLPHSSTFHNLIRDRELPLPMSPIAEQFQSPSIPNLSLKQHSLSYTHHSLVQAKQGKRSAQMVRTVDNGVALRDKLSNSVDIVSQQCIGNMSEIPSNSEQLAKHKSRTWSRILSLDKSSKSKLQITISRSSSSPFLFPSPSGTGETSLMDFVRPWSISKLHYEEIADVYPSAQIQEYMPALYWAGRFQSRFDQWRTAAMNVELGSHCRGLDPLAQCKLTEERAAACQIFLQIRDVCMSERAADSLWEFEYQYRQEHKMLGTAFEFPPLRKRKQDTSIPKQGAMGRAVRKLTPRKSSFVNLLKGKGWNREEMTLSDSTIDFNLPRPNEQGWAECDAK